MKAKKSKTVFSKLLTNFQLITYNLLLITLLSGCASAPYVYDLRSIDTVMIDGNSYVSTQSLCRNFNLEKQWDPVAKKLVLIGNEQEVRLMVESATALLNQSVYSMGKEAKFYQGEVFIPQAFVRATLVPLFKEKF